MKRLIGFLVAAVVLTACPPVPPNPPPPPDATDALAPAIPDAAPPPVMEAAPAPVVDAAPAADSAPKPTSVCQSACDNMTTLRCSTVKPTCAAALAEVELHRFVNDAGRPVTCKCVAMAASKTAVEGCGIGCR